MRPFRPALFGLLSRVDWWWEVSPRARLTWLLMLNSACTGEGVRGVGCSGIGLVGISHLTGHVDDTQGALVAIEELKTSKAITEVEHPGLRYQYEIANFQAYADALDTHRAAARNSYWKRRQ